MNKYENLDRVDTLFDLMSFLADAVEASEVDELLQHATATNDPEAIFESAAVGVFSYSRTGQMQRQYEVGEDSGK